MLIVDNLQCRTPLVDKIYDWFNTEEAFYSKRRLITKDNEIPKHLRMTHGWVKKTLDIVATYDVNKTHNSILKIP